MLSMVIGVHHVWRHRRRADADDNEAVRCVTLSRVFYPFESPHTPNFFLESISPRSLPR
jgi:hypothetical protein